jgi:hypothetical protein
LIGQPFVNIAELAAPGGGVGRDQLIVRATHLFVKGEVGRAAQTAPLGVLVKNAAKKKGIIPDMRPEKKRLLGGGAGEGDQHVGNVLPSGLRRHVRSEQSVRARERFQKRRDIIAELAIGDTNVAENVPGQDIKIKMRRNPKLTGTGKDRVHQARIIQDTVAGFGIAEKIDQGNVVGLGTSQDANDEIEIRRREARPTIRLDHRRSIMSIADAGWQVSLHEPDLKTSCLFASHCSLYLRLPMKTRLGLAAAAFFAFTTALFGNGGAWQTGVPVTGNAAASDQKRSTNVTIEEENLTIDLHQEFAAVEVRYRMRNTGEQVEQDFFFPLEKWAKTDNADGVVPPTELENYKIAADGTELKATEVDAKGVEKPAAVADESSGEFPPASRLWKKSRIPFARNQMREVVIKYRSRYAGTESSVSEDFHATDAVFEYALSPAATWKGPISKGKITVNLLHPRPEEVFIAKPTDRFKKINDTQFQWEFDNLKPTLADDLKIVAHKGYDKYQVRRDEKPSQEHPAFAADYIVQGDQFFFEHTDYEASASSTLKPSGDKSYEIEKLIMKYAQHTWAEGVEGDGIGETISLKVRRPLPLDSIMIMPGYQSQENPALWSKNNRVAELEIALNDEHTFTVKIPDEKFLADYPIPIRDYAKPVNTVKLTIKGVHKGTAARDTCISALGLRCKLSEKPKITPAR